MELLKLETVNDILDVCLSDKKLGKIKEMIKVCLKAESIEVHCVDLQKAIEKGFEITKEEIKKNIELARLNRMLNMTPIQKFFRFFSFGKGRYLLSADEEAQLVFDALHGQEFVESL